jgi:hypothetical protein
MTTSFIADFRDVLEDPATWAAIATLDEVGIPHIEVRQEVHLDEKGRIVLPEDEEHSRTNLNLVRSLWFGRNAVLFLRGMERSYEVVLKPYKVHISGPLFEYYYRQAVARSAEKDFSGVWILQPVAITEETTRVRHERENAGRIPLVHLDRIAK